MLVPTSSPGVGHIAAERNRQVDDEGFGAEHDDRHHTDGSLARLAALYAMPRRKRVVQITDRRFRGSVDLRQVLFPLWWDWRWWKPTPDDRIRELAKAGALCAAEIDRLLRAEERGDYG